MATHYEVLGVARGVSAAELRAAYVAKARALHPDRHGDASATQRRQAERAMQEVNAAWTVLSDPRARREYDETLRRREAPPVTARAAPARTPAPRPTGPPPVVLPDLEPVSGLPTLVRLAPVVLLLGVLGAILVITAYATGNRSVDVPARTEVDASVPSVGSCIAVAQAAYVEVACENPHALRVERIAPGGDECAGGAVPLRWDDDTTLCVRPPS